MLTVEVKDPGQRPLAQFAILAIPSSMAFPEEQLEHFSYLAQATGERYFFLVTSDLIHGWVISRDLPMQPSFRHGTIEILGRYARHPSEIQSARDFVLAGLVQVWLSDVANGWKSGAQGAPGLPHLEKMGLPQFLRASATVGMQGL